jgi:hypothetical protein
VLEKGRDGWNCRCAELAAGGPYDIDNLPAQVPLHPNCNCQLRPILKTDEEIWEDFRREVGDDGLGEIEELDDGTGAAPAESAPPVLKTAPEEVIVDDEKVAQTLHTAEMSIKDLVDHEEAMIIGRNGEVLAHQKGEKSSVNPPPELIKGNIVTHNHPGGVCTFSVEDIEHIIKYDGYELRAVTRDGRFVSIKKGSGEIDTSFYDEYKAWRKEEFNSILAKKLGSNFTIEILAKETENLVYSWMRDNAPKFGYIFTHGNISPYKKVNVMMKENKKLSTSGDILAFVVMILDGVAEPGTNPKAEAKGPILDGPMYLFSEAVELAESRGEEGAALRAALKAKYPDDVPAHWEEGLNMTEQTEQAQPDAQYLYSVLKADWDSYRGVQLDQDAKFLKTVCAMSAGAFGLSFAFVDGLIPFRHAAHKFFLVSGWALFAATIGPRPSG